MTKQLYLEICFFIINCIISFSLCVLAYNYYAGYEGELVTLWDYLLAILYTFFPLIAPVVAFIWGAFLSGFQIYLSDSYRSRNYTFLAVLVPILIFLLLLSYPNTIYELAFRWTASNLLVSLPLVTLRLYLFRPTNENAPNR